MSDAILGTMPREDATPEVLTAADGTPLKQALARTNAKRRRRAFFLVFPLLAFVIVTFIVPIGQMMYRSVHNPIFSENMPRTTDWFAQNEFEGVPGEDAFEALALDLGDLQRNRAAGQVGTRINYDRPGSNSLFKSSARRAARMEEGPYKEALIAINEDWGTPEVWSVMRRASSDHTIGFYVAALDLSFDENGDIERAEEARQIYIDLFVRTFVLSAVVAGLCFLLGFPIAHLLATLPLRYSNLLMIMVLLPFWTSLLVRTTSWIVLLQSQGVVNDVMVFLGIVDDQGRVQMMYNQIGTVIAMTHILLPFMVLPLYSVMKTIPPSYVRAAKSLGANPWTAFWRIYFPQTVPGIGAGSLLVFILAVGYYITPALVGGSDGQLISNMIAFHMQRSLNWNLAAALGALLLFSILILYWLYDRLIGIDRMKLG